MKNTLGKGEVIWTEKNSLKSAGKTACAVGGIVCAAVFLCEAFLREHVNMSVWTAAWSVYLAMMRTMLVTKYRSLKKTYQLVFGILELLFSVLSFALFVMKVGGYALDESLILKNHLKEIRTEQKLLQAQLAQMIGVSRNTIIPIETGQFCPSAKLALILCIALDRK